MSWLTSSSKRNHSVSRLNKFLTTDSFCVCPADEEATESDWRLLGRSGVLTNGLNGGSSLLSDRRTLDGLGSLENIHLYVYSPNAFYVYAELAIKDNKCQNYDRNNLIFKN